MKICHVCKQKKKNYFSLGELDIALKAIFEQNFLETNKKDLNNLQICKDCANELRIDYMQYILKMNKEELFKIEEEAIENFRNQDFMFNHEQIELLTSQSFGAKLADALTDFGGSWYFILLFIFTIFLWIVSNTIALLSKPFDPYPFILLNLVLSCVSALQAPIILMSQNRAALRDRLQAKNDYITNLKAELEIRFINLKLEKLLKQAPYSS